MRQQAGRGATRAGQWARPRIATAGRSARDASRRWQEPLLQRAERRHAARQQARQPQAAPARTPQARRSAIPHYPLRTVRVPRPRRAGRPRPAGRTR
jgi:hypothetical protein